MREQATIKKKRSYERDAGTCKMGLDVYRMTREDQEEGVRL